MNRRDFIKFLGKSTVASGVAAAVGLPVVKKDVITPLSDSEYGTGWEPVDIPVRGDIVSVTYNDCLTSGFYGELTAIDNDDIVWKSINNGSTWIRMS